MLFTVISKGASAITWQFLTGGPIPPNVLPVTFGGMGAAVYGTLVITGFAALMAIPLGVLGGIYINEYGGNQVLARVINFFADVMTGVPSIIMGLFIFTIWVLHFGYSGFAGSLALACLMLPIVIRSTYEMLRLVPDSLREASYALGATKARVTADRGAARRRQRHRQRRAARRSESRGRDCAAALHHPHRRVHRTRTCSAAQTPRWPRRSSRTRRSPTPARRPAHGAPR